MVTPAEILEKSLRQFLKLTTEQLAGSNAFPVVITANKKLEGTNFSEWKKDLVPLYEQSKAIKGKGYSIDWKPKAINGIKQQVPTKIYFETFDDYLAFTKKQNDFNSICEAKQLIATSIPLLENWAVHNPALLLKYNGEWADLLKVLHYFLQHPPPHRYYLRELPIEVHSKFVETNTGILKPLLDLLLPDDWKNLESTEFAARYFLKKPAVLTQIRILDDALKPILGYDECSLTIDDAAFLQWVPQTVFIVENQACFLSFPKVKNAVAIWGEGFKARLTKHIPWLGQTKLYCWFDLDAAGFEMLNMIRSHYPNAKNLMMDERTLTRFQNFTVPNIGSHKQLPLLSEPEKELYHHLIRQRLRLEQERISQVYIQECLTHL